MKNFLSLHGKTLALISVLLVLAGLLGYVALRAGPLAPVDVTVAAVACVCARATVRAKAKPPARPTSGRAGHSHLGHSH